MLRKNALCVSTCNIIDYDKNTVVWKNDSMNNHAHQKFKYVEYKFNKTRGVSKLEHQKINNKVS
jgi:hypothetical protein